MSRLTNCDKCGHAVSPSAVTCPNCKNDPRRPVTPTTELCWLCNRPMNPQDSSKLYSRSVHDACLLWFRQRPEISQFACPDCRTMYSYPSTAEPSSSCAQCGRPFNFVKCAVCRELVMSAVAESDFFYDESTGGSDTLYYHKPCKKLYSKAHTIKGSNCFIATVCYGSETAAELQIFTKFRDEVLLHTRAGSNLVNFYYVVSPTMARIIGKYSITRLLVRSLVLSPILLLIKPVFRGTVRR